MKTIRGTNGHDILFGTAEANRIVGKQGNDTLYGGGGNDILSGGPGTDHFIFEDDFGRDTILDDLSGKTRLTFRGDPETLDGLAYVARPHPGLVIKVNGVLQTPGSDWWDDHVIPSIRGGIYIQFGDEKVRQEETTNAGTTMQHHPAGNGHYGGGNAADSSLFAGLPHGDEWVL